MSTAVRIVRAARTGFEERPDVLAVEEPLEIRLGFGPANKRDQTSVAITMRTPGHDSELALGFLFAEGIVKKRDDVLDVITSPAQSRIRVDLKPGVEIDLRASERRFYVSASCGVCGKTSAMGVAHVTCNPDALRMTVARDVLLGMPIAMRSAQPAFGETGGLHAAALFQCDGKLLFVREDIGRHNAVDKILGVALQNRLDLRDKALLVSGRVSFEIVQKAAAGGIPILAAIGAPSSLAVRTADSADITLAGFVRQTGYNIYASAWRLS